MIKINLQKKIFILDLWFEGESIMVGEAWQQVIRAGNREITPTHARKQAHMHAHSRGQTGSGTKL